MKILNIEYLGSLQIMIDYINSLQESGIKGIDGMLWDEKLITNAWNLGVRYVHVGQGGGVANDVYSAWLFDYKLK
jgi:hypothetical protein